MIEFHERALAELRQAQSWYRARSVRAAERFLDHLTQAADRMACDPASQPIISRRFHYVRVRKFPFILVYEIRQESDVFVIALAHTSRRPGYWARRK